MKNANNWNWVRTLVLCGVLLSFAALPAFAQNNPAQPTSPTPNAQTYPQQPAPAPTDNQATPSTPQQSTPDATSQDKTKSSDTATQDQDKDKDKNMNRSDDKSNLPKTASEVPLTAVIGMFSLGSALLVHARRRRVV